MSGPILGDLYAPAVNCHSLGKTFHVQRVNKAERGSQSPICNASLRTEWLVVKDCHTRRFASSSSSSRHLKDGYKTSGQQNLASLYTGTPSFALNCE